MCKLYNLNNYKKNIVIKFEYKLGIDVSNYILSFLDCNYKCCVCSFEFQEGFYCSDKDCDNKICDLCYNHSYGFNNDMKPFCYIHYDNHYSKTELKTILDNYNMNKVKKINYKYTNGINKNNIKNEVYKYYPEYYKIPNIFIDHNIKIFKRGGILYILLSNNIYDSIRLASEI